MVTKGHHCQAKPVDMTDHKGSPNASSRQSKGTVSACDCRTIPGECGFEMDWNCSGANCEDSLTCCLGLPTPTMASGRGISGRNWHLDGPTLAAGTWIAWCWSTSMLAGTGTGPSDIAASPIGKAPLAVDFSRESRTNTILYSDRPLGIPGRI